MEETITLQFPATIYDKIKLAAEKIQRPLDQILVEAVTAPASAIETAYRAKYGKFHPRLYDHLETVSDDTRITVNMWISGTKTDFQIYQELGQHFPEMAQLAAQGYDPRDLETIALAQGKDLAKLSWDEFANPVALDLQKRIEDKYDEIWYADTQAQMAPVKEWLQREGYDYHSFEPMPMIDAKRLTKEAVYRLAEVETVVSLDLIPEPTPTPPVVIHPEQLWPQAQALAFETLASLGRGDSPPFPSEYWQSDEPGLVIITSQAEMEAAKGFPYIGEGLAPSLSQVDFGTQIAIIAFRGWQGAVHLDFQVKQVLGLADEVILVAQRGYLDLGEAISSPFHLITVPRDSSWSGQIVFKLYFEVEPDPVAVVSQSFE